MGVDYIEHPDAGYVEVVIDRPVRKADMDRILPRLEA